MEIEDENQNNIIVDGVLIAGESLQAKYARIIELGEVFMNQDSRITNISIKDVKDVASMLNLSKTGSKAILLGKIFEKHRNKNILSNILTTTTVSSGTVSIMFLFFFFIVIN